MFIFDIDRWVEIWVTITRNKTRSLLTGFGFKRIFGTAMNKNLLICFLNSLFNGRQVVKDVSYLNPEHVGGK